MLVASIDGRYASAVLAVLAQNHFVILSDKFTIARTPENKLGVGSYGRLPRPTAARHSPPVSRERVNGRTQGHDRDRFEKGIPGVVCHAFAAARCTVTLYLIATVPCLNLAVCASPSNIETAYSPLLLGFSSSGQCHSVHRL